MTPDDIDHFLVHRDYPAFIAATAPLTEADRRKLSTHTHNRLKLIRRYADAWNDEPKRKAKNALKAAFPAAIKHNVVQHEDRLLFGARFAAFAFCPLSVTKSIPGRWFNAEQHPNHDDVVQILDGRRPDWATDWLTARCDGEWPEIEWDIARALIEKGICQKPDTEGYIRLFADFVWWRWRPREGGDTRTSADYLADNPDLLDHEFWQLFRHETGAFTWNATPGEGWLGAVATLIDRGLLDRQRVLDASLTGLTSGLRDHVLGGFAKLHQTLAPTPDELDHFQPRYRDLLPSPTPRVVAFALSMLKAADKAKRLDDVSFLRDAAAAFDCPTKGPAKATLTLIKKALKRSPNETPAGIDALLAALRHPSPDIQADAFALLQPLADAFTPDHTDALAAELDALPPTVQPEARALLATLGQPDAVSDPSADPLASLDDLTDRLAAVPDDIRRTLELDEARDAVAASRLPPPPKFRITDVPVTRLAEPVTPIADMEDLIDAVAHAVEVIDHPWDLERILDGMLRLLDQRGDDFAERTAPLRKRVEPVKTHWGRSLGGEDLMPELQPILFTWLQSQAKPLVIELRAPQTHPPAPAWLFGRINEIDDAIKAGQPRPLLATPTHTPGWIEPATFVQRLADTEALGLSPLPRDLAQALIRLAPDQRDEALQAAESLKCVTAPAVRYALGGPPPTKAQLKKLDHALWLAAGRARTPYARLDDLKPLAPKLPGPNGIEPATFQWTAGDGEVNNPEYVDLDYPPEGPKVDFVCSPAPVSQTGMPTIDLHRWALKNQDYWPEHPAWYVEWFPTVWPAQPDAILGKGIYETLTRLYERADATEPNHAYLVTLLDPDRPFSELSYLALCVGLVSVDAEVKGLVLDALIEGIADGRVHPKPLGQTLARLAPSGWLKLNRLTANLEETARVSPLHALVVADALTTMLPGFTELPRDAHHALGLLHRLLTQVGLPLADPVRPLLEPVKGSSKTAKLAKALLQQQAEAATADYATALHAALDARVTRAERWVGDEAAHGRSLS
ncbi:MAG: DUF6493 family protein [Planctomycetota bacterium]